MGDGLRVYKFLIGANEEVQDATNPDFKWSGCVAVAIAPSKERAMEILDTYGAERGQPTDWIKVARVIELPADRECGITIALI